MFYQVRWNHSQSFELYTRRTEQEPWDWDQDFYSAEEAYSYIHEQGGYVVIANGRSC